MVKNLVNQTIKDEGGAPAPTVVNTDDMYYDEKTGTWKKKETTAVVDTSYAANTGTAQPSEPDVGGSTAHTAPAGTNPLAVDISYAANAGVTAVNKEDQNNNGQSSTTVPKPTQTTTPTQTNTGPGQDNEPSEKIKVLPSSNGGGLDRMTAFITGAGSSSGSAVSKDDTGGGGGGANNTSEIAPSVDTSYAANAGVGTSSSGLLNKDDQNNNGQSSTTVPKPTQTTTPTQTTPTQTTPTQMNTGAGLLNKDDPVNDGGLGPINKNEPAPSVDTSYAANTPSEGGYSYGPNGEIYYTDKTGTTSQLNGEVSYDEHGDLVYSTNKDTADPVVLGGETDNVPTDTGTKELAGGKYYYGPNGEIYYTDKTGRTVQMDGTLSYDEHGNLVYSTNKDTADPVVSDVNTEGLEEIPQTIPVEEQPVQSDEQIPPSSSDVDTSYGANGGYIGSTGGNAVDSEGRLTLESAFANTTPIDSYDEYLRKRTGALKDSYDATGKFYDEQEQKALGVIEEQRQADLALAEEQKAKTEAALGESVAAANKYADEQLAADLGISQQQFNNLVVSLAYQKTRGTAMLNEQKELLFKLSDEQKAAVYAYAEEKLASDIAFANKQYGSLVDAIATQKAAGEQMAAEQRELLLNMSEAQRNAVLAAADEQYKADIEYANKQYGSLVDALAAQKASGDQMADDQRSLLLSMSETQRNAVLAAANEQYESDILYATRRYQTVIDAINNQKVSGEQMAAEQRDLLLNMSEEMRTKVYEAAEIQKKQAYTSAEVERERSVVDARSSYERNKVSYGAKAEAMAGMGLTSSGYSDRIDMAAYAQQRAETQNANARASSIKREADYNESQQKLSADTEHLQNKYNAEAQYSKDMYDIDTSYRANMLEADQTLADREYEAGSRKKQTELEAESAHRENQYAAESQYNQNMYDIDTSYRNNMLEAGQTLADREYAAESEARTAKHSADAEERESKYIADSQYSKDKYELDSAYEAQHLEAVQNKDLLDYEARTRERESKHQTEQSKIDTQLGIDLSYAQNTYDADTAARKDTLTAAQNADAGRFNAELSYRENMLTNDDAIAAYRQQKEDEALAKIEAQDAQNKELYLKLFDLAKSGSYTAEDIQTIAGAMGLGDSRASGGGSVLSSIYDVANTIQQTITDEQNKVDEANNAAIKATLTGEESPYELDNYAKQLGMDVEDLKDMAGDAVPNTVKSYLDANDISGAMAAANKAKESGVLDTAGYQSVCFDIGVKKAQSATDIESLGLIENDLLKMKNSGQLTKKDYDNLVSYMYQNYGKVLDKGAYEANIRATTNTTNVVVTIGDKTYTTSMGYPADEQSAKILNEIIGMPYKNALVGLDNKVYYYENYSGNWYSLTGNSSFATAFNAQVSTNADVAAPTHRGVWQTFEDAAADRGSVMSEQMWSKDKQGYSSYQEYLAAMWKKQMG